MNVRTGLRGAWTASWFALLACGGDDGPAVISDEGPGRLDGGNLLVDGGGDAGTGPIVQITAPSPSSDPTAGPVLTGASVEVLCSVRERPGGSPIDPTMVSIAVYGADTSEPASKTPAVLRSADTFGASIALDKLPTGPVRIRCSALDTATTPMEAVHEIQTYYDAGPVITFTNLTEMSVVPRGKSKEDTELPVQFKVEPARLSLEDVAADITDVRLTLSGQPVLLDAPQEGAYKKSLDLDAYFGRNPVDSVTLEITATNRRTPTPAVATKKLVVKIDSEGPTITFGSPMANAIVGGTVAVRMNIADALGGVAEGGDKLYALILYGTATKRYTLSLLEAPSTYGFTFEASEFATQQDITVQVHAFDRAGNERYADLPLRLDTVPPWVSLDPPNVRVISSSTPYQCSQSFDPLGASPEDGQIINQAARFRALVWERGIQVSGQTETWLSGVQERSVQFFAQFYGRDGDPASAPPLIIDQDRDGICDTVNNAQELGADAPYVTTFGGVTAGGNAFGTNQTELTTVEPIVPSPGGVCGPLSTTPPSFKCDASEMTYVISHNAEGRQLVVYAQAPVSTGLGCTGVSFDVSGIGGWTCVVAAARDRTGSLGISMPLRVCRNKEPGDCIGSEVEPGKLVPPAALTCTDGCTMPALSQGVGMDTIIKAQ